MAQVIFVDESGPQDSRYTIPSRFGELAERFEFEIVWVRRSTPEWEVLVRMSDSLCLVDRPRGDFSFVPPIIVAGGEIFEITMIADSLLAVAPSGGIPSSIVEVHSGSPAVISVREIEMPESIEIVDGFFG
jgi:hypothetical protein